MPDSFILVVYIIYCLMFFLFFSYVLEHGGIDNLLELEDLCWSFRTSGWSGFLRDRVNEEAVIRKSLGRTPAACVGSQAPPKYRACFHGSSCLKKTTRKKKKKKRKDERKERRKGLKNEKARKRRAHLDHPNCNSLGPVEVWGGPGKFCNKA